MDKLLTKNEEKVNDKDNDKDNIAICKINM